MKKFFFTSIAFIILGLNQLSAQCAMCRATVENNVNNGEAGIAPGLNYGILYLFAAPYLLIMIIGFLWYKKSKKSKGKINIKELLSTANRGTAN
ncbi:hypothetical protein GCM10011506_05430 [Marivirga lumbricoides]|uniref:Uncharacterized protein n=1 Tax=Marivirga lumbricoides TaxID=1046115 RepID=A0A2T4DSS2_9BACT|nr:hypothetical protein C9994_05460 [Marivirga lumbricoides]GGC23064.1 hypothetical protein GCM10011506_05430 [Marivirga lumbricoides]